MTAHLVEAGGKRLRPMLTLAAARMCGYDGPYHVHLAATVEFIHTATLLHDDVVDESQRRRGRPTANLLVGQQVDRCWSGDYLFARSFQLMVETGSLRVLDILSNAAATIAEGEVLQLTAAQDLATDERIYLQGRARQDGGAVFGGDRGRRRDRRRAGETQVRALRDYGDALGIAFQIVDDLLDYGGSARGDRQEHRRRFPRAQADAAGHQGRGAADADERAFWVRVIEKGDQHEGDLDRAMRSWHGMVRWTRPAPMRWAGPPWRVAALASAAGPSSCATCWVSLTDFVVERIS